MKKNFLFSSIVASMLLLGTGCGGGGSNSSDSDNESSGSVNGSVTTNKKTGYYLDSAVVGVSYSCEYSNSEEDDNSTTDSGDDSNSTDNGDEDNSTTDSDDGNSTESKLSFNIYKTYRGETNADGSFSYEDGQTCTFSVGGVILRKVNTSGLEDGIVFEDNIQTAQFLQTLDIDGDPSNGIQIDSSISSTIASDSTDMNHSVPQGEERLAEIVDKLQDRVHEYQGHLVTEEEAKSHLEETLSYIQSLREGFTGSIRESSHEEDGNAQGESSSDGHSGSSSASAQSSHSSGGEDNNSTQNGDSESSSSGSASGNSSHSSSSPTNHSPSPMRRF